MKVALITGATSGIGMATAEKLADENYALVLCGRRADRLDALKTKLCSKVPVHTLVFDIQDEKAITAAINSLPPPFKEIDVLINNAGNAHGLDPVATCKLEDLDQMFDTNVKGLLYITRVISAQMIKRERGHIINVGSIASKEVYANGTIYCATKHAVDTITKGLRMELYPFNIKVAAIHPGMAETEFSVVRFKGDKERAAKVYAGFLPLLANDIADAISWMLSRPSHVNIADMLILPSAQASATLVKRT